jgi:hypothetical protein
MKPVSKSQKRSGTFDHTKTHHDEKNKNKMKFSLGRYKTMAVFGSHGTREGLSPARTSTTSSFNSFRSFKELWKVGNGQNEKSSKPKESENGLSAGCLEERVSGPSGVIRDGESSLEEEEGLDAGTKDTRTGGGSRNPFKNMLRRWELLTSR